MNQLAVIGFFAGLWAAFFQSLAYLGSRHFMHPRPGSTRMLLVISHLWMGAVSLAVLPFVWPAGGVPWSSIAVPVLGASSFYLLGQFGLLLSLRNAHPSQVAPMLALKLLMLAGLTVAVRGDAIYAVQWLAVILCIAGTFILNWQPHDRLPIATMGILLATCFFYSLSDWNIGYLTPAFGAGIPQWQAIMCGSLMCYGLCGLVSLPFIPLYGSRKWADWRDAMPYSAAWLTGVFGLYASFALVGVVYGGILQSTRTIMGVFLAALLTRYGHTHIEHMRSRGMFFRRLAAAVLMTLAVVMWAAREYR